MLEPVDGAGAGVGRLLCFGGWVVSHRLIGVVAYDVISFGVDVALEVGVGAGHAAGSGFGFVSGFGLGVGTDLSFLPTRSR
jgi:hypothetical protein